MTLSEYILEETNDGIDMARVLIDVMNGFIRGVTPGHRLIAARLLTIYGFQDAHDFVDDNTLPPSPTKEDRWVINDTELARLIRARTNDGQEMCQFLIDVMWGKVERTRVGHRVSAARELLNRAFGKNQGLPLPNPSKQDRPQGNDKKDRPPARTFQYPRFRRQALSPVEGSLSKTQVPLSLRGEGWGEGAPRSVHPEPSLREPAQEREPAANPEGVSEADRSLYRAASRCIDPNFDPILEVTDRRLLHDTYDGCDNISCPYHGDPEDPDYIPNYDPNTHHY